MKSESNENYEAIVTELKLLATDISRTTYGNFDQVFDELKKYVPDTPIEVMNVQLEELAKPAEDGFDRMYRKYSALSNADEIINISDFQISPRFVADDTGEPTKIHSFSIVHDRTDIEPCRADRDRYVRPILYSQWLKQMMMRTYGYKAGIINYFPRSIGLGKLGCSWWWQKLMFRRLASILCGDYYTPYDTSEVNLEAVIFMSTYEALPKSVERGIVELDSMNVYGTDREMHTIIMSLSDVLYPSYGKYLDNLEIKWPWSAFPVAGIDIETPSSKFNEAMKNAETKDKNVSTKHKRR